MANLTNDCDLGLDMATSAIARFTQPRVTSSAIALPVLGQYLPSFIVFPIA
ncbi:hypothetical protein H6G20_26365 [Desertifilum sp. FACHB-1129]|uniref:Uncharacterized protein n=1 Tax=Desertifilum tharense IPPAS B-1220 TaxID=1781255 RepID=A0ACD5GMT7_9CYAN|nr:MULTISPECIES: hypothetical protein [Desertifilum]MBD2315195.1 hypothetical protein [Desertifilum sp. FACHB-1129]MBD2320068.1 hypothetical protein [Desertifilum sp. FACHB-866]MBD2330196.1 hypothetical protein [Desertifilum sp. FACHB-868]MDA0211162.1 hypothetical protein [Cyanobacteria bacterium FC1]